MLLASPSPAPHTSAAKRLCMLLKLATLVCLTTTLALGGYFLVRSPVAFQKCAAIRFVAEPEGSPHGTSAGIPIGELVGEIPYRQPAAMVYEVLPQRKYQQTIRQGQGNCSNLVFGLAYALDRAGEPYQVVHLMPPKGFLEGQGHTVLHCLCELDGQRLACVVDLLEGGLPQAGQQPLQLADLRRGKLANVSIRPFNNHHDASSPYYGTFLDGAVIGVIDHREVHAYFAFLEAVYIPLGHSRLEKLLYDGLAMVLGYYPTIEVAAADRKRLLSGHGGTRLLALILLGCCRLLPLLALAWLAALAMHLRQRRPACTSNT